MSDKNEHRTADERLRSRRVVQFVALAAVTGVLFGVGQFLFGRPAAVALAGGVLWGVLWAGGFFVVRRLLAQ